MVKRTQPPREVPERHDWDAEVAAWMAERSRCRRCGDELVRDPALIGAWLSATEPGCPGYCRAVEGHPATAPHEAAADVT